MATTVKAICFVLLLIGTACAQQSEGDSCKRSDGSTGECKNIEICQAAKDELSLGLVPAICGFQKHLPIVCCPLPQTTPPTPKPTMQPVTPTKPPAPQPGASQRKSQQKCKEYSKYAYAKTGAAPLVPDYRPPADDNTANSLCVHGNTLIIGGTPAVAKEFPHMANIGFEDQGSIRWACAGSLISERFVLTAAHCLSSRELGLAKWIRLGELNLAKTDESKTQDFSIVNRFRHPEYTPPAHYNDIALLQIDRDANFDDGYVRPACIHPEDPVPKEGLVASGWGLTDWVGSKTSDVLLKVSLENQEPTICNETFAPMIGGRKLKVGITPESMLCVGDLNGGKDTCKGDSGGPLQMETQGLYCMYDIVGITSFGSICGAKNAPAIYTRVSHYVPWIENIVWP